MLVNSAGLRAPTVARSMQGYRAELAPRELYAKGNYYSLARRSPFSRLVYPVPEPGGLGVHVTLDLAGQARFGPDVEWVERIGGKEDYAVDPRRAERFYAAIRRYWPGLPDGALLPGYAGIRPKTAGPRDPAPDFQVQGPTVHSVPGLVHLFGIESPGLTASLALAESVVKELG
jgi:L-2-hydroxyglutarate oxidase LhgO